MAKPVDRTRDLQPIIDRMVAGDGTAIPALIDRSCERLRKLTRKMLKSCPGVKPWEDTDDVQQGAAIRLHRSLEAVKPATVQAFFGLAAVQLRRQLVDLFRHYHGPEGEAENRAEDVPDGKSAMPPSDTLQLERRIVSVERRTSPDAPGTQDRLRTVP